MLIGVCYRPELGGQPYIDKICANINDIGPDDTILVGDFNFRDIDWQNNTTISAASKCFLDATNENYLQQIIEEPTRDKYINDLVLTNNTSIIQKAEVGMPFGNSDHKMITMEVRLFIPKVNQSARKVYMYSQGHYPEMDKRVNATD